MNVDVKARQECQCYAGLDRQPLICHEMKLSDFKQSRIGALAGGILSGLCNCAFSRYNARASLIEFRSNGRPRICCALIDPCSFYSPDGYTSPIIGRLKGMINVGCEQQIYVLP